MRRAKKTLHIRVGQPARGVCPNCGTRHRAVTGFKVGLMEEEGPMKLTGKHTVCESCGALLMFSDERGTMRPMTPAERAAWNPDEAVARIVELIRKRADFTRR